MTSYDVRRALANAKPKTNHVTYFFLLPQDVMRFMVTFVPIFLAFMVGMYNLYWYYDPSVRSQVEIVDHKIRTRAEEGFGTYVCFYLSLFLK